MNERIFHVLEFNKIIDQLRAHTATSLGAEFVSQLTPSPEMEVVEQRQNETDEAAQIIRINEVIPLGGIVDIRAGLKRSEIGGVLNTHECLDVANTLYGGRLVKTFMDQLEDELPILQEIADRITPLRDLEQQINRCIDDHGNVLDNASASLRGIRSSIRASEGRVRERLENFTRTKGNLLSDSIITIRNDRYVLPVKQEHRNAVGGVVHDQSASGQTVFMEPKAVVELNNKLQDSRLKEKQEIDIILRGLSEKIASQYAYLYENVLSLAEIDFIYARAKLGKEMNAAMPKINDQGIIKMMQARHPLIPAEEVVANDIEIGETYSTIVITGPNTGGKTVILKMVGLCVLMAQSGLQIPAYDGCEIAVFDQVYADIGDEQSIEQNLSTFSSHMTNIVNIMEDVNDKSLVLFDELGAGTDPQEGAALAMSILDEVLSRDARIIATTHYPELKAYGYNRENVTNASVEFDIETLQPTYRLLIGVPGRSNAFEISTRLGLEKKIIERAKTHIGIESKQVESMIQSLEESKRSAEQDYEKSHAVLLESEQLKKEIEDEWAAFDRKKERLYTKAEEKAEKALKNARDEAELIIEEIRKMKTKAGFKEHEWIDAKKMLTDAQPDLSTKQVEQAVSQDHMEKTLEKGDEVTVLSFNQTGIILEQLDESEYIVQVGNMRVNVKRSNLQLRKQEKQAKVKPVAMVKGSSERVRTEIDIRGERYQDALSKVEKYIDDALLAGHNQVTVIHGKGTGALRKGVQNVAKNHPSISEANAGTQSEGGDGVTIIRFS